MRYFSSDDDDTLITQPDDVALNGSNGSCKIFTQRIQSDESKISDNDRMSTLVIGSDLFQDFSKTENENLMPSLEEHPGFNSLSGNYESPGNYTLGVLGESPDKLK